MISVIFDMDGTLLDTQQICVPAWEHGGSLQGIKGMGEHIPAVCGMNEAGWSKYLADNFPTLDIAAFKKATREYIIKNGDVKFKKGAKELLDFLKEKGVKTALASGSSHESINHHLKEVKAENYFEAIVGSSDVINGKPAPDIFLLAAEKLGAKPQDCFIIEDSANGILSGYNAGMKCIGVPDLVEFPADIKKLMTAELSSLDEAIELFRRELK